ncbi:MAG: MFS transporter [Herbiconiux sp.]|nr:MFS transporter [Herbiconiux sp.]TAJ48312.1 MAG: MFS transporter [Herbiconiux sp.]
MTSTLTRPQLHAWRNAIFAIFALSGLSIASWVARIPSIRDSLGVDTAQIGALIFAMSAGAVLGLILSPPLINRIGARAGIVVTLVAAAIGLAIVGLGATVIVSPAVVAIGLFLFGLGNGCVDVIQNVEGAAAERAIGKTLLPLMHAFFSFGTVAGAALGALASFLEIDVAVHLAVISVLVVVSALIAIRFVPEGAEAESDESARAEAGNAASADPKPSVGQRMRESLAVWKDPRLIAIGLIVLGMAFAEGSSNDWLALAMVDGHGQDNTVGALVFGVFTVAMTVGRVVGGPLLDRFGRVPVLRAGAALTVIGLLAFIFAPVFWLAVVGAILWGLGCSLGFPVGMSAAADADNPKLSAARVSMVAIIGYAAFLVGPPVLGVLGHAFGILNALLVVLVLVVVAGLASPAARERMRRPAVPAARE